MKSFTCLTKSTVGVGMIFLAGCATTPTLNFEIPRDKIIEFNECMIPAELSNTMKNNDAKAWLKKLQAVVPNVLRNQESLDSLAKSLPDILSRYADKDNLTLSTLPAKGEMQLLSVPFKSPTPNLLIFDSNMEKLVNAISQSANIFTLIQDTPVSGKEKTVAPNRIAKALKTYLLAYFTVHQEGGSGFVSRDGTKFQFPMQINSTSNNSVQAITQVDHSQVGADIIRITLEAVRDGSLDACLALPARNKATTATNSPEERLLEVATEEPSEACKEVWRKNNKHWKGWKMMTNDDFDVIETQANAAESMIATAAGKAIRGGSMASLDNEALARAVETASGVIARHTTERVEWCKQSIK